MMVYLNPVEVGAWIINQMHTKYGDVRTIIWYQLHDDIIKWKHFPGYWPFVWEFTGYMICAWINDQVNNREVGYIRHNRAHYEVTVI